MDNCKVSLGFANSVYATKTIIIEGFFLPYVLLKNNRPGNEPLMEEMGVRARLTMALKVCYVLYTRRFPMRHARCIMSYSACNLKSAEYHKFVKFGT